MSTTAAAPAVLGRPFIAGRWLTRWFGPEIAEPVRLHVDAKRYLCAAEPGYLERLSQPSRVSLELQGGPMTDEERRRFEASPDSARAVELRRWDDAAKVPDLDLPGVEYFVPFLEAVARRRASAGTGEA